MSRRTIMPFLVMYFIVAAMMVVSPSYADTKLHEGDKPSICPPSEGDKGGGGEDGWHGAVQKYTQQLCDICRAKCHFALHDAYQNMPPIPVGDQYLEPFGQPGASTIDAPKKAQITSTFGKFPLYFIQNNGQVDKKVKFYEQGNGHAMFFTGRGVYLSFAGRQGARGERREAGSKKSEVRSKRQDERSRMRDAGGSRKFKIKNVKCKVQNQKSETLNSKHETLNTKLKTCSSKSEVRNPQSAIVRLFPLGGNKHPEIVAEGLQGGKVNYLTGNNPSKWKSNIPTYNAVVYKEVYKGIDIKFYGNNQQLEYDIIVKPGANPSRVRFAYQGIEGMRVTDGGDLEISVNCGKLVQKKPHIYQEIDGRRVEVAGEFKVHGLKIKEAGYKMPDAGRQKAEARGGKVANSKLKTLNSQLIYSFKVAAYNKHHPLVIDPAIVYSTYLEGSGGGGRGEDVANGIAVDAEGNVYVTGYTDATNYPTKSAVYGSNAGGYDVFITKIDASGNSLVYSTYLGGSDDDYGNGIAVDADGNAYVTGYTKSDDFPTASALYGSNAGRTYAADAFVAKLDAKGENLVYSTYLGGWHDDYGNGIAVDNAGNAYVTGSAYEGFPTKSAIYDYNKENSKKGLVPDAFVTKLNASGSSLIYSTFLGGSGWDSGYGIAVDIDGSAYVTGETSSKDFPTASAIYRKNAGQYNAFVTKLNASGSSLVYSTYLGGSYADYGKGIAVDNSGNAYITGYAGSDDFPTVSALYGNFTGTTGIFATDAFVTKLDAKGKKLVYSTYLGGSDYDYGNGIAVDTSGNAYIAGYTYSGNFPTVSAIYGSNTGYYDAFVTKLSATGSSLVYSTYLGGSGGDTGNAIAVDTDGNVYITANAYSYDFPTASPLYESSGGFPDIIVTKLNATGSSLAYSTYLGGSGWDYAKGIAVDTDGNAYVTGYTKSDDFSTASALYGSKAGDYDNYDAFVTKLNPSGSSLVYSTYLGGGSGWDYGNGIAVDTSGNAYVTGYTNSIDFPTASTHYGNYKVGDAFVTKINATGSSLVYSAYLAGSNSSYGYGIAVDTVGNVYVTGFTYADDFPLASAIYSKRSGSWDAFVTKLNTSDSSLVYSTYLGGSYEDYGYGIAVDADGNAYVTGYTGSKDFPTASALYGSNAGNVDAFVAKLNPSGSSLVYSTYLGGSNEDSGNGIAIDTSGNAYVTGYTYSYNDFPTASAIYGSHRGGKNDAFVTKINDSGSSLEYSTYLGGWDKDTGSGIAVDTDGNAYVTGTTYSSNFPTKSAYDSSLDGGPAVFVTKIGSESSTTTDTSAPVGSIVINDGAAYAGSSTVTVTLTATDDVGVTGYYISEDSTAPSASDSGWTSVSSTTGYNETLSYSLSSGEGSKTLYAWFKDDADNVSGTASAAIIVDTTLPLVTISSPTSSSTYTSDDSTISLSGSASDSSSITGVTWSNSMGGNGTATGTASWTASNIALSAGDNVITVTAVDNAGNTGTDAITVTYNVSAPTPTPSPSPTPTPAQTPTPKPSDTTAPNGSVTINSGASYTNATTVTLDISASDSVGVTGYYIAASSSTPSASASGWTTITSTTSYHDTVSYTVSGSDGAKTVYAWYKDAGGNVSSTASDDITLDTASPTTTITSPTSNAAYTTTSSAISISGSASDGASGINGVTWSSSNGEGGAASGTTSWTVSSIDLSEGDTTITVTAKDGAGNAGTDTIVITYKVTTPTPSPSPIPSSTPIPGTIYGLVYDPDGNLFKGVAVAIQNVSTDFTDSAATDENGFYHFIELAPSKYLLTYTKSGYSTHTEEAELEEDGAVRVEVSMEAVKVGSIYGYTKDINNDPVEDVRLNLKGLKTGLSDDTASDKDGYFSFDELEPDTYSIIAKKKRYKQETEQVTLEEGESTKVEFEMNRTSKRIIEERQTAETQRR